MAWWLTGICAVAVVLLICATPYAIETLRRRRANRSRQQEIEARDKLRRLRAELRAKRRIRAARLRALKRRAKHK